MSFNQSAPTVPTVLNTSNCFVFGNTASGNALSVQQLGAGNCMSVSNANGTVGLFVSSLGRVGVGTTSPGYVLDVLGSARVNVGTSNVLIGSGQGLGQGALYILPTSSISGTSWKIGCGLQGSYSNAISFDSGTNVGIGTTSPNGPLEVQNQASATTVENLWLTAPNLTAGQQSRFFWGKNTSSYNGGYFYYSHVGDSSTSNYFRLDFNGKNNVLCAAATGYVGIGTASPGYALDVQGPGSPVVTWTGYLWYNNSTGNPATSGTDYVAVNTNGAYRTTNGGFLRVSDVRIKKNIQPISNVFDAVLALKPCTFQYIDEAKLGSRIVQGFIAQEVEQVLPGVVNKTGTGYVPDIYTRGRVDGTTIILDSAPKNTRLEGLKIQVYYQNSSNVEASFEANVVSYSDKTITIDCESPSNEVFVYGTFTDRMYSVSNESMVPTLVAAIQELSAENTALKSQLQTIEARLAALEQSLATVTANVSSLEARA
jgi:hypothetical protein